MKSLTNSKLKKKLKSKGITLDEKKKKQFDNYSYYQVVNAYKNIFITGIENIDDIEKNIVNSIDLERYYNTFSIQHSVNRNDIFRKILIKISSKYGITFKNTETNDELKNKIKNIKYYNHLYSKKVIYSDFIRIYKFEHELRNVLLKYTLIIEESLKNVLVTYLNNIEAKDNFFTDINNYNTNQKNIENTIKCIKKIFDKQTNKYSNPIKRKNDQEISVPYWIIINELTLGETLKLIINLDINHMNQIFELCLKNFTNIDCDNILPTIHQNRINFMREILNIIGLLRNCLAHNQPIYNFNVKEYYSTKNNIIHYNLPKTKSLNEQYILTTNYMSYLADFFGSDKYNSFAGNTNINLSWIIYVIYNIIMHLDKNSNIYNEIEYVYKKYNIILRPSLTSLNNMQIYEKMITELNEFCSYNHNIKNIKGKYKLNCNINNDLNEKVSNFKENMIFLLKSNQINNECNKYTHFLFDSQYTKYTGIDKKFFDKLKHKQNNLS